MDKWNISDTTHFSHKKTQHGLQYLIDEAHQAGQYFCDEENTIEFPQSISLSLRNFVEKYDELPFQMQSVINDAEVRKTEV